MEDKNLIITGSIILFILFIVNFLIAVIPSWFQRSGKIATLWTSLFVFFLFINQGIFALGLISQHNVRIVNIIALSIVLFSIVLHLFINRKIDSTIQKIENTK